MIQAMHAMRESLKAVIASRERLISIYESQQRPALAGRIAVERDLLARDCARLAALPETSDDLASR